MIHIFEGGVYTAVFYRAEAKTPSLKDKFVHIA